MADFPPDDDICGALESHVRRFFENAAAVEFDRAGAGLLVDEGNTHFRVLRVTPPAGSGLWRRAARLLAMTAHYHRTLTLGAGHTYPIHRAWMRGSKCDHFLISLP